MKKAIVTGANGFVGSTVCEELSRRGVEVIALVRSMESNITRISGLPGLRIFYCTMEEYCALPYKCAEKDIDVVFHFAWEGSAGTKRADEKVQLHNVQYSFDLIRACAEMGCKRFVFASSIMIYEIMAQAESGACLGINTLYCSAKLAADYMISAIASALGVTYLRAIVSNIYGPGETSPRLINSSLRKFLNGERGAFSAGKQLYDFIYSDDAAVAFVDIGEKGVANQAYYIGNTTPRPLKEFLLEMKNQVDPELEIGLGEIPYNGVSLTYKEFDTGALYRDTGFVPKVSFQEGIRRTIQWMKKR